jgi:hypothetical protein
MALPRLRADDAIAFLATAALTSVLLLPLCDVLHRCGCRGAFRGGRTHCNVHQAVGPRCPWCAHPVLGTAAVPLTLAGQWLVYRAARGRRLGAASAAAAAAASLPVVILPVAAVLWLPTDYPHFLIGEARARLGLPAGPIACGSARPAPPAPGPRGPNPGDP